MSRIGKLPVNLPKGVTVTISDTNMVSVKGPLGELTQEVDKDLKVEVVGNELILTRPSESKNHKSLHGLYRALIHNMVVGVSEGYKKELELVGVGYRAEAKGQNLEMSLGYSHEINILLPIEVKVETKTERRANPIITLKCIDKQLIGHVAAKIRSLRPPEPYKGKGIKFVGEQLRRKAGKSASV
ncbi:MAG: 50S ribosomal protein L6 [Bacteroidetes bacterium GWE2_41_25]|nr:MAG: 50S ribosomal protein L6 [Bacteroidetes bacterium GWA2_40_15]OFX97202.1 MAG: 50S ribosomal protein L6 [Bacteroidetes bacterium GWC2_40_22]OFY05096.1 MAG: 50S ribosomal protein L6 [Bacteroidetes bacterium GWE2_41_25]HAM09183.1 50S ribosomal protein L6 [Bacteroidales bacterium]HBH85672.1 50S ribosomal protein L6 [Bacteroidales bacterium]